MARSMDGSVRVDAGAQPALAPRKYVQQGARLRSTLQYKRGSRAQRLASKPGSPHAVAAAGAPQQHKREAAPEALGQHNGPRLLITV